MKKEVLSQETIKNMQKEITRTDARKSVWVRRIDSSLFWLLLVIAIVGNFCVSVILVPFFLIMKGATLYGSLFFIGMSFGWLFSFILHSIEQVQKKRKIIASIFIPSIALINVGIFAILSNRLIEILQLSTPLHNPAFIGAMYVLGYIIPDALAHLKK